MRQIALLFALGLLTACGEHNPSAPPTKTEVTVDTVYRNATIWTGTDDVASVFAVKDGRIAYLGNDQSINFVAKANVDLGGRFVMPGFIDNHVHFFEGGAGLASVQLRDAKTPEAFSERIVDYAKSLPDGRWVLSGNWDHEQWGGELPRRDWIDADTGDTPVFVFRLDGHMALANSAALALAGIDAATPTPAGGEIVRDNNGEPTGVLKGTAMNPVLDILPKLTDDELMEQFQAAQSHAFSVGLTQVHAVVAGPTETGMLDAFRTAEQREVMKIRVTAYGPIESWQSVATRANALNDGGRLRIGGVKGLVDGSLGSTTAWFYEPYSDQPDTSGLPLIQPGDLGTLISNADAAGLQLAIHAIGDRAIDNLIDELQATAGDAVKERRYRIEHFQHPSATAIERAAQAGIIASAQPYHAIDDGRWAEQRIGPERLKTTYAFRSILDAGGLLSFGSDWPVAPLAPLEGIYAAVTRRTTDGANPNGWVPQEKITVEEALAAYTATNAYAGFSDDETGTLVQGKQADFIVLSADPRQVPAIEIPEIKVLQTVIGGETVYTLN